MRLPRGVSGGVSGDRLIHALERIGYGVIRQEGSHVRRHVRLRHEGPRHERPPVHAITVPRHNPRKTGTLSGIPSEVAQKRSMDIKSIADLL